MSTTCTDEITSAIASSDPLRRASAPSVPVCDEKMENTRKIVNFDYAIWTFSKRLQHHNERQMHEMTKDYFILLSLLLTKCQNMF